MKQAKIYFLIIQVVAFTFFVACNNSKQIKFDKEKWIEQADPLFPSACRSQMLTDLITNIKLKGLTYAQIIALLGVPDSKDSVSLSYKIVVEYKHDIDPVYTKDLDFTFSKDSIITSFKVNE